jgi:polar amino acid transport system ATP-binding protein
LEAIDQGTITVDGKDINNTKNDINALRMEMGMVFRASIFSRTRRSCKI